MSESSSSTSWSISFKIGPPLYAVLFFVGIEIGLLMLAQVLTSITAVLDDVLGEGFPFTILEGTHEELMQLNGRYAALFRMQARWYG
jgi:hypothetical protein